MTRSGGGLDVRRRFFAQHLVGDLTLEFVDRALPVPREGRPEADLAALPHHALDFAPDRPVLLSDIHPARQQPLAGGLVLRACCCWFDQAEPPAIARLMG